MIASTPAAGSAARRKQFAELLENGAHLSASEFLRRYEAMPEVKKAELINGIVYMGSPVRYDQHGKPDNLLQTWLGQPHLSRALARPSRLACWRRCQSNGK